MVSSASTTAPSKVVFQALATFVANFCMLGYGCAIGWASPALPILRSDASPLATGPLTLEEAAWVGSILSIAAICGTAIFGYLLKVIGSKNSLVVCSIPLLICWILLQRATLPWHLYLARFFAGFCGGGVFLLVPMFVAEIASDHVRGRLSSAMLISYNAGIVIGYFVGARLPLDKVPLVLGVVPVILFCTFIWFPSSPQFLLSKNQDSDAESSLRFYRNCPENNYCKESEIELKEEFEKMLQISKQNAAVPPVVLADFGSPDAIRGIVIGLVLMTANQFTGPFTLATYAATIFQETGSTIDPGMSSIIMGITQLVGTIFASSLIDRVGRKLLLLISAAGTALALLMTGAYCYLNAHGFDVSAFNMLPVVTLSAFIFLSAIGLNPVPYVVTAESLPPKIRRIGMTVCVCNISVAAFIMLRFFPVVMSIIGLHGCMFCFATVSTFAFVFTTFVIKETNGINLDTLAKEP